MTERGCHLACEIEVAPLQAPERGCHLGGEIEVAPLQVPEGGCHLGGEIEVAPLQAPSSPRLQRLAGSTFSRQVFGGPQAIGHHFNACVRLWGLQRCQHD